MSDDHVQEVWYLTHPTLGDIGIDLWTDGESVRVIGEDREACEREACDGGRKDVERLLAHYQGAGYQLIGNYEVNTDPATP